MSSIQYTSLEADVRLADAICLGRLEALSSSFFSYEYGLGSRSWHELVMQVRVSRCLKGQWPGELLQGTYTLPGQPFGEGSLENGEESAQVIQGSGLEAELQQGGVYLFFLSQAGGVSQVLRVDAENRQALVTHLLTAG